MCTVISAVKCKHTGDIGKECTFTDMRGDMHVTFLLLFSIGVLYVILVR